MIMIRDSLTARKDLSRQRKYQLRQAAKGMCVQCGRDGGKGKSSLCKKCRKKQREASNKHIRVKNGWPLDKPLTGHGRPRIYV